jgi:hypothetical protein
MYTYIGGSRGGVGEGPGPAQQRKLNKIDNKRSKKKRQHVVVIEENQKLVPERG